MEKIILERNKRKIIDSIFEHDTPSGKIYSIHFTDSEETVWCEDYSSIFVEIEKHIKEIKSL